MAASKNQANNFFYCVKDSLNAQKKKFWILIAIIIGDTKIENDFKKVSVVFLHWKLSLTRLKMLIFSLMLPGEAILQCLKLLKNAEHLQQKC